MNQEVLLFNKINSFPQFRYSVTQIAKWSNLDKSHVSRFLNGKNDMTVTKFFQLLRSMPNEFQQVYWSELLNLHRDKSWRSLILQASMSDIEEILNALAERWGELVKSRELVKSKEEELAVR
jgi:hypothetical protein